MAVEKGDWVKHVASGVEGEVEEIRNDWVVLRFPGGTKVTTPTANVRITTRPQTGLRKGSK
jgi:preprotein translocase subunit YajC